MKNQPQAYITGVGLTQFGEHFDTSLETLIIEAALKAVKDSHLKSLKEIDLIIVASMTATYLQSQGHLSSLVTQLLGTSCPVLSVDAACASSGSAIGIALQYIKTHHNILIIGAEKLTDHDVTDVTSALMRAASYSEEGIHGVTFPGLGALIAQRYFHEYNKSPQLLEKIAIKNHLSGSNNPIAHMRKPINSKTYQQSPYVADPLRLFDCAPVSDGAAALIVTNPQSSIPATTPTSSILAHAQGQDSISLHHRETLTSFKAVKLALQSIKQQVNFDANQINILELHDAFTILEPILLEDLNFYKPGTGFDYYENDNPQFYINTSGGYKACGHPVAASGLRQISEIHHQLTQQAQDRQINISTSQTSLGLTVNLGGMAGTASLTLLSNS